MLVRAILPQAQGVITVVPSKYNSAFLHLQALNSLFRNFKQINKQIISISTGKLHVFLSHNAGEFRWTRNLYLPLNPD